MATKTRNQWLADRNAYQIDFGCNKKEISPVITESDFQFIKISLKMVSVQKTFRNFFKKS